MKLINIGYGNLIAFDRVISIVAPESAPVKRMVSDAKAACRLIDASCGRKISSVIVCDNNTVVLSALTPQTLQNRAHNITEE